MEQQFGYSWRSFDWHSLFYHTEKSMKLVCEENLEATKKIYSRMKTTVEHLAQIVKPAHNELGWALETKSS